MRFRRVGPLSKDIAGPSLARGRLSAARQSRPGRPATSASSCTQARSRCLAPSREYSTRTIRSPCTPGTVPASRLPSGRSTVTSSASASPERRPAVWVDQVLDVVGERRRRRCRRARPGGSSPRSRSARTACSRPTPASPARSSRSPTLPLLEAVDLDRDRVGRSPRPRRRWLSPSRWRRKPSDRVLEEPDQVVELHDRRSSRRRAAAWQERGRGATVGPQQRRGAAYDAASKLNGPGAAERRRPRSCGRRTAAAGAGPRTDRSGTIRSSTSSSSPRGTAGRPLGAGALVGAGVEHDQALLARRAPRRGTAAGPRSAGRARRPGATGRARRRRRRGCRRGNTPSSRPSRHTTRCGTDRIGTIVHIVRWPVRKFARVGRPRSRSRQQRPHVGQPERRPCRRGRPPASSASVSWRRASATCQASGGGDHGQVVDGRSRARRPRPSATARAAAPRRPAPSRSTSSANRPARSTSLLSTSSSGSASPTVRSAVLVHRRRRPGAGRGPACQVFCAHAVEVVRRAGGSASSPHRTPERRTQSPTRSSASSSSPNRVRTGGMRGQVEHLGGGEPGVGEVEQPGDHREHRVGLPQRPVGEPDPQPRVRGGGAAAASSSTARRRPPRSSGCVGLDVRAHHHDVARLQGGVVGEQPEQHLAQHLDLALPPVAGVHLHRPVAEVASRPRGAVLPDVLLQPAEQRCRPAPRGGVVGVPSPAGSRSCSSRASRAHDRSSGWTRQVGRRVVAARGAAVAAPSATRSHSAARRVRQPQVHVAVRGQRVEDRAAARWSAGSARTPTAAPGRSTVVGLDAEPVAGRRRAARRGSPCRSRPAPVATARPATPGRRRA